MLTHTRKQHAVGQGFFHSGELELGYARFRYVYDCGSENMRALHERVKAYIDDERTPKSLDALFISHLDHDHVSGLDEFLTFVATDTVVLPYLSDIDVFALAGAACIDGALDADFIQFLSDPVNWLGDRGVSRVIFISGNASDSPEARHPRLPDDPILPEGVDGIDLSFEDVAAANDDQRQQVSMLLRRSVQVVVLPHHVPLILRANGRVLNWGFISFVHPDFKRKAKFQQEVMESFPELDLDNKKPTKGRYDALIAILRDPEKRSRLADCYLAIRKDRNLTSMSVYSGPFKMMPDFACSWSLFTGNEDDSEQISEKCGWLGTGDANLRSQRRRDAFLHHYHYILNYVRTMSLPHHGSRHNFSLDLLDDGPPILVAAAGKSKRYGHPHHDVLLQIKAKRRRYFITTEMPDSTVLESVQLLPVIRGKIEDFPPYLLRAVQRNLARKP
jgi:hypothetical protein